MSRPFTRRNVPDDMLEITSSAVRLLRAAEEGDRLENLRSRLASMHPDETPERIEAGLANMAKLCRTMTEDADVRR